MTIEITENTIGIWFLEIKEPQGDWMCGLSYVPSEDLYRIDARFRWYDVVDPGNDPFSKKDKKSWMSAKTKKGISRDEAMRDLRDLICGMEGKTSAKAIELLMDGKDVDGFIKKLTGSPFAHTKTVTPEEFKRDYEK